MPLIDATLEPQVTNLSITARGEFPVVGIIHEKGSDFCSQWTADGFALYWRAIDATVYRDLIEVTKEQWDTLISEIKNHENL